MSSHSLVHRNRPNPSFIPACLGLLSLVVLSGCGGGAAPDFSQMPPTPVSVAVIEARELPLWATFSGRIEASASVEIRPRVAGYLAAVHFQDGSRVQSGQLLYSIDDREFRAAVNAARAQQTRATARLNLAEAEWRRSERLLAARATAAEELEQRRAERDAARAEFEAARAQLEQAELNLSHTQIRAPFAGRIGATQVQPGTWLGVGAPVLSNLVALDPVHVIFHADERSYLGLESLRQARDGAEVAVEIGLADSASYDHRGSLDFVDPGLDPTTGSIRLRATLANADGRLTPGLYARVRMLASRAQALLLLHEQAVLTDQDRKYVYVVGDGERAERRDVVLADRVEGLRVVRSGLRVGDRVVVNGMRKIFFPGQPLQPELVPMSEPNQSSPDASSGT